MLGIPDSRSIGYHKMKHGISQKNLCKYARFESADIPCEKFNKFAKTLKKEKEKK